MTVVFTFHRKVAPYESAWLLLLKVFIINDINFKDFFAHTLYPRWMIETANRLDWSDPYQMDLDSLQASLNIPFESIIQSYLGLTISAQQKFYTHDIKHCARCIGVGYHSTFFLIPFLTHCPWHGEPLVKCAVCARVFAGRSISWLKVTEGPRFKPVRGPYSRCVHYDFFLATKFPRSMLSQKDTRRIIRWGARASAWLKKAQQHGPEDIACFLRRTSKNPLSGSHYLYFRWLESKIGPSPIVHPGRHCSVMRIKFPSDDQVLSEKAEAELTVDDTIQCLRSLRRYIYRRYVRQHRKCMSGLKSLSSYQCHHLDVNRRCTCGAVYLAWCTSLTQSYSIQNLFQKRTVILGSVDFLKKLTSKSSVVTFILAQYASFLSACSLLELHASTDPGFRSIHVVATTHRSSRIELLSPAYTVSLSDAKWLHLPSLDPLLEHMVRRCRSNKKKRYCSPQSLDEETAEFLNLNITRIFSFVNDESISRRDADVYV